MLKRKSSVSKQPTTSYVTVLLVTSLLSVLLLCKSMPAYALCEECTLLGNGPYVVADLADYDVVIFGLCGSPGVAVTYPITPIYHRDDLQCQCTFWPPYITLADGSCVYNGEVGPYDVVRVTKKLTVKVTAPDKFVDSQCRECFSGTATVTNEIWGDCIILLMEDYCN